MHYYYLCLRSVYSVYVNINHCFVQSWMRLDRGLTDLWSLARKAVLCLFVVLTYTSTKLTYTSTKSQVISNVDVWLITSNLKRWCMIDYIYLSIEKWKCFRCVVSFTIPTYCILYSDVCIHNYSWHVYCMYILCYNTYVLFWNTNFWYLYENVYIMYIDVPGSKVYHLMKVIWSVWTQSVYIWLFIQICMVHYWLMYVSKFWSIWSVHIRCYMIAIYFKWAMHYSLASAYKHQSH